MVTKRDEQVLLAAAEVFGERGYRGASIDAVAERAGLTRQGVLHYYPSKRRLLFALLHFREELNRRHVQGDGDDRDLPGTFAEAVAFDQGYPFLAQVHSVLMAEAATGQEPAREFVRERSRTLQDSVAGDLTARYGERLPSGLTAQMAATAVLALLEGLQQQWLVDSDDENYPQVVRDSLAVLLLGAQAVPSAPSDPSPPSSVPATNG
ncbi:TetR/AcrR family transcriptional regulator [Streptomyces canus]|uniref:TetR/AcrR family transcriptional regulator n=1 Tax=Streptomyces canus TaxID=58343 RepID=UPI003691CF34